MEKIKRRSKKDLNGREYACSCGKKYLSYPALYTHIKTKHDGITPERVAKKNLNCNQAFEEFLKEKQEEKYQNTIQNLKMCLNARGFQMDNESNDAEYCSVKTPKNIPKIFNYFLIKYLPARVGDYDLSLITAVVEEFSA